ncbi:MAG: sensor histidine kinase, partial [Acidimicrobiia bacterium]
LRRSSEAIRRAGDQLLMLQRYTAAAREELLVDELDLAEVVEDVRLGVDLGDTRVEVADDLPVLVGDRRAVERVLHELLDNVARHAGDDGPPTARISATDEGDAVVLVVDDDGPGIAPDQRRLALSEGERLGRTGDGFGLGLAIVRIVVARHGGAVELGDAPDGGLRVTTRWPDDPPLLGEEGDQG